MFFKKISSLFMIFFCFSLLAEDNLTIVAVGQAEKDSEKISFQHNSLDKLNPRDAKAVTEMIQIFQDDFAFYRSRFAIESTKSAARFVVTSDLERTEGSLWGTFSLLDQKLDKKLYQSRQKVWTENLRSFAHHMADEFYQSIIGKGSIFKSKIVFVSDRTSSKSTIRKELYIMDFDGHRKQRLTFQNSLVISPAISPDNKKIVFTLMDEVRRKNPRGGLMKVKNLNLYELDLGKKNLRLISSAEGINSGAIFNKTGSHIYLTLSKNKNADIYKLNLQTRKLRRITSHFSEDVDPHINADESLMTFLSGRPGKAMIYTMDPAGLESKVKRISFVGDFNAAPRFNPEGTEIAFSSWVDNRFDIYRIGSDGRNLVRLTKNFGSNEEPWYSPDGEFIVFSSQRVLSRSRAVQDLYIMDRNGEIIKKITSDYGKIFTPRWSN